MLSQRLKYTRKKSKLTQEELSSKVNTTKSTISNYENGHSTPSNEMLVSLSDALDVTTDYLLGKSSHPRLTAEKDKEVDKEADELLAIIESMPEEKRKEMEAKILAYARGLADANNDN